MTPLICLHGNPSDGQEFALMQEGLQQRGFQAILHKRSMKGSKRLDSLLHSINATGKLVGGKFGILAYSWGAFLALAYIRRYPENVSKVFLVNPLLCDPIPLPTSSKIILSTPGLRSLFLKIRSRKLAANYMKKCFLPGNPSQEAFAQLQSHLLQPQVWRGEASYKKLMQTFPLSLELQNSQVPVKALFGACDEVAPPSQQLPFLQRLPCKSWNVIADGGHALPWTHTDLILEEVQNFM